MPKLDGTEAAQRIRAHEKGASKEVPIVALTAHALSGDREKYLGLGMNGYVTKPLRRQELFRAIHELLEVEETH